MSDFIAKTVSDCKACGNRNSFCNCILEKLIELPSLRTRLSEAEAKYAHANKTISPMFWEERKAKDEALERLAECQAVIERQRKALEEMLEEYCPPQDADQLPCDILAKKALLPCLPSKELDELRAGYEARIEKAVAIINKTADRIHGFLYGKAGNTELDMALSEIDNVHRIKSATLDLLSQAKLEAIREFGNKIKDRCGEWGPEFPWTTMCNTIDALLSDTEKAMEKEGGRG